MKWRDLSFCPALTCVCQKEGALPSKCWANNCLIKLILILRMTEKKTRRCYGTLYTWNISKRLINLHSCILECEDAGLCKRGQSV